MLAHKFAPHKVVYPCFVQPKLNGVRGIYLPKRHFQSRYGEIWSPSVVEHAFKALSGINFHLDGEFYKHGMSLQQINSRIGVIRNSPHVESKLIKFCIFDIILDEPFYRRVLALNKLREMFKDNESVKVVKTFEITSESEADYYYKKFKHDEEFEGMMYRTAAAPYGFASRCGNQENRWNYLLKRKEMVDMYATIVALYPEIDSKTNEPKERLGAFELQNERGVYFRAGSGLTHQQRELYWKLGNQMIGVRVRIKYEMNSDSGIPLKPIIECVETEDDIY